MLQLLVIDDEEDQLDVFSVLLGEAGYRVDTARDAAEARAKARQAAYDVVIADLVLPDQDGVSLLRSLHRRLPSADLYLMSGHAEPHHTEAARDVGARATLRKPIDFKQLVKDLARAALCRVPHEEEAEASLVGEAKATRDLRARIARIARSSAAVLIEGETGTGKDVAARLLHAQSARAACPFIVVNCAGLPDALLESELFGHVRGSFTGALRDRIGRFAAAHRGTLFLDEVGELSPVAQGKLLRVLETSSFEPLGANRSVEVDVRVVAATHRNLRAEVAAGRFREDLFYRLQVVTIAVPPLRARREDIPLLVQHFIRAHSQGARGDRPRLTAEASARLLSHDYPGNVRELSHAVEHALALCDGEVIDCEHLPAPLSSAGPLLERSFGTELPLDEALRAFERDYLVTALSRCEGRRAETAKRLGISRKNLWERLRRHGL